MRKFNFVQEAEEWLAPMDYDEFWVAVMPYGLDLDPRDHCDGMLARGEIDEETLLGNLKYFAKRQMRAKYNLGWRIDVPDMVLH